MISANSKEIFAKIQEESNSNSLEFFNGALILLGTLVSVYFQNLAITLSFLAGGGLTAFNLRLLKIIVKNLTAVDKVSKSKLVAQVLLKFLGGLGALAVLMLVFKPHPIAFLLGLSTIVVAVVMEGVVGIFRK